LISNSLIFNDAFSGYIFIIFRCIFVSAFMYILIRCNAFILSKGRIERAFRGKATHKRNIFQAVHLFRQHRFGILHPVPVNQCLHIAMKHLINGIRQIRGIRAEYSTNRQNYLKINLLNRKIKKARDSRGTRFLKRAEIMSQ